MGFAACLPIILQSEGGFVDNPADPGGATNKGVTLATYSQWLGRRATVAELKAISDADVAAIYRANYWNAAHCDDLSAGVDLMVFDTSVNSGPVRAVKMLQQALGVAADGVFGPATKAAAQAQSSAQTIIRFHDLHATFYRGLPTFPTFGKGWLARNDRTRDLALQMATQGAAP